MLSKKLFMLMHKIALFAIVFASLAPSVSHAIVVQNNTSSFLQEVCSSKGKKITIQVTTTKGQQRAAEFDIKKPSESAPKNVGMHLEHCPFCSNGTVTAILPSKHVVRIGLLEKAAHKSAQYTAPAVVSAPYASPPSQAPPSL